MNETSRKILAAAFKCISDKGCASVSLRDIADEAGVALSQLNYYFKNKETLFSEVLRSMSRDYVTYVDAALKNCATVEEKIIFLIDHNRSLLVDNTALYRSFLDFFNLAMWSKSFQRDIAEFLDQITDVARTNIGDSYSGHVGSGVYSAETLARTIFGTSFGLAVQYLMSPEKDALLKGFDVLKDLISTTTSSGASTSH